MGRQARLRKETMTETSQPQPTEPPAKPGVGVTIDAGIIDALVSIAFRSEQGGLLWHGWCLGRGLPVDRVYLLKVAAGEITDSAPKPPQAQAR